MRTYTLFVLIIFNFCFAQENDISEIGALKKITGKETIADAILNYDKARWRLHIEEDPDCGNCDGYSMIYSSLDGESSYCRLHTKRKHGEDACEKFLQLDKKICIGNRKDNKYPYLSYTSVVFSSKALLSEVIIPAEITSNMVRTMRDGKLEIKLETKDKSYFCFVIHEDSALISTVLENTKKTKRKVADVYLNLYGKDKKPVVFGKPRIEVVLELKSIDQLLEALDNSMITFQHYTPVGEFFIISGYLIER